MKRKIDLERLSDTITDALGSSVSVVAHSVLFLAIFRLWLLGIGIDEIPLILTTAVSLEAIYLPIFIQRSTNRQAVRIESAVEEIRRNTEETLVRLAALTRQEIDEVGQAVEDKIDEVGQAVEDKIEDVGRRIEEALRPRGGPAPGGGEPRA